MAKTGNRRRALLLGGVLSLVLVSVLAVVLLGALDNAGGGGSRSLGDGAPTGGATVSPEAVRGEIVAGEERLLPFQPGDDRPLAAITGQAVEAQDAYVVRASEDGLLISASARDRDRLYVALPDDAGDLPAAGDRVGFSGVVRDGEPDGPALEDAAAAAIERAGGHVEATALR